MLLTILFCLITAFCAAGEIASIRIHKLQVEWPNAKLYFDILDSQEHPEQDTIPSDFTAIIGTNRADLKEIKPFSSSEEGAAYILLIDISKSLSPEKFTEVQQMASVVIDKMSANDQACILTFDKEETMIQDFTGNKKTLKEKLNCLSQTDKPAHLYKGLASALRTVQANDTRLPSRRSIILASDGENDPADNITSQEIFEMLRLERLPIFAVGYFNPPLNKDKKFHLDTLCELARYSGGAYYQSQSAELSAIFADIIKTSKAGFIAYLTCPSLDGGPGRYKIQLSLKSGDKMFTDTIETTIFPSTFGEPSQIAPTYKEQSLEQPMLLKLTAFSVFLLLAFLLYKYKNKTAALAASPKPVNPECTVERTTDQIVPPSVNQYRPPENIQPSPHALHLLLTALSNPSETFSLCLCSTILVGKGVYSNLILANDSDIADMHCELSEQNAKLYVTDLDSKSGTFVNNVPIKMRVQLQSGDILRLGKTELRVTF